MATQALSEGKVRATQKRTCEFRLKKQRSTPINKWVKFWQQLKDNKEVENPETFTGGFEGGKSPNGL